MRHRPQPRALRELLSPHLSGNKPRPRRTEKELHDEALEEGHVMEVGDWIRLNNETYTHLEEF